VLTVGAPIAAAGASYAGCDRCIALGRRFQRRLGVSHLVLKVRI
jgi:hypothetical protein